MRLTALALIAATPLGALAQTMTMPAAEPVPLSPFQQVIQMQLNSRMTEPPPPPVPGYEAEAMRQLPPLRDMNANTRSPSMRGSGSGQR